MFHRIDDPARYRAALYIRLSKEDEGEGPSQSVTNQKALLYEFAEQQRLNVYDAYVDDGWSGTRFDRPAFQRMLGDIEAKRVNMVVTKDLSRLGRDYILTGHYMERYFPEHQVRYISLLDGIDTGVESSANDITPFRAIMNDMYAKDVSKKIKSVKREKQRRGQFIGGKAPYGYRLDPREKNKLLIDTPAADIVRRIFSMAYGGMSCRRIAEALNAEGVPSPSAYAGLTVGRAGPYTGLWSSERISDMLGNEMYIGNMVQGRVVRSSYKSKKCLRQAPEQWVVVEGTHEPIVDRETFRHVRSLVESRRRTRSRTHDYLLKGLLVCHECGHPLAVLARKNAAGEGYLYLVCRTYQRFTRLGVCSAHCVKERLVTDAVLGEVRALCEPYLTRERLLPVAREALAKQGTRRDERETLQAQLDALSAQLDAVYMDKLSGLLADADFARVHAKLTAKRDALTRRLEGMGEPPSEEERAEALTRRFLEAAPESRALLVRLIKRVELTEDREVIVRFRVRAPFK